MRKWLLTAAVFAAGGIVAQADDKQPLAWDGLIHEKSVAKLPNAITTAKPGKFAMAVIQDEKTFKAFFEAAGVKTRDDWKIDWAKQAVAVVVLQENTNRLRFKGIQIDKDKSATLTFQWDGIEPYYSERNPAVFAAFDKEGVKSVKFVVSDREGAIGEVKLGDKKDNDK